jgi:Protein of unknown function (DUF4031)
MIYVDALVPSPVSRKWRWSASCHLFADDLNELHDFARRMGLQRSWFQPDPRLPHYDLTPRARARALAAGAQSVSRRFVAGRIRLAQQ